MFIKMQRNKMTYMPVKRQGHLDYAGWFDFTVSTGMLREISGAEKLKIT